MTDVDTRPNKRCFVTVGATASFTSLIQNVLQPSFLKTLQKYDYTQLRVQYGKNGQKTFDDYCWLLDDDLKVIIGIEITGFDFNTDGLAGEMLAAKRGGTPRNDQVGTEGCVISHAGSGSILDAMRIDVPVIVVPNTDLLDNHQVELAEILAEQNYVVHGDLSNLSKSIPMIEELRRKKKVWPPIVGTNKKTPRQALVNVLDDELGWLD